MRHQPEAWTAADVKVAKDRLARLKLNMGGVESCRMLVEIKPKGGGKAFRGPNVDTVLFLTGREAYVYRHMENQFDYLLNQLSEIFNNSQNLDNLSFRKFHHEQRMQRQQTHKHAN